MAFDIAPPAAPRSYATPQDYIAAEKDYGASNYKPLDVVLSRGEGVYVWDVEGTAIWIALPAIRPSTRATAIPSPRCDGGASSR